MIPSALLQRYQKFREQYKNNISVTAKYCYDWAREELLAEASNRLAPLEYVRLSARGNMEKYTVIGPGGRGLWMTIEWLQTDQPLSEDWRARKPTDEEYSHGKCSGNSRCVYIDKYTVLEPKSNWFDSSGYRRHFSKQVAYEIATWAWQRAADFAKDVYTGSEIDGSWFVQLYYSHDAFKTESPDDETYIDDYDGAPRENKVLAKFVRNRLQFASPINS